MVVAEGKGFSNITGPGRHTESSVKITVARGPSEPRTRRQRRGGRWLKGQGYRLQSHRLVMTMGLSLAGYRIRQF